MTPRLRALALLAVVAGPLGCGGSARRLITTETGLSSMILAGGDLWIGHKTAGLMRMPVGGGPLENVSDAAGLKGGQKEVRGLAVDGETLWLATAGGVVRYSLKDRAAVRSWGARDGLGSDSIRCVMAARGQVWAGSIFGAGRLLPGQRRWKNYQIAQGLPQNHVYRLADDGASVWASCMNGGLATYEPAHDRWRAIPQDHGLGNKSIYAMEAAPGTKELWLGTAGGVNRYDTGGAQAGAAGSWDAAVCDAGFTDYCVYAVHRAGPVLWFGTTYGLYRRELASGHQRLLGASAGLTGEDVVAVLEVSGRLLVASRTGIASIPLN